MAEEINVNKISADVISELAKNAACFVVKKLRKAYKDFVSKEDIDYGTAFEKYLLEAEQHISMAKTIWTNSTVSVFFFCVYGNKQSKRYY